jgi:hypothetical protein
MSREMPKVPEGILTPEQVEKISGGLSCSADDIQQIFDGLRQNYDTLVEFTSYVIEQVVGQP